MSTFLYQSIAIINFLIILLVIIGGIFVIRYFVLSRKKTNKHLENIEQKVTKLIKDSKKEKE